MTTNTELIARLRSSKEAPYTCDAAADAIEMLEAENASITNDALKFVAERDALQAQLAAAQGQEPFAYLCVLPTKDAGPTTFFTAPSDPRGFPVYIREKQITEGDKSCTNGSGNTLKFLQDTALENSTQMRADTSQERMAQDLSTEVDASRNTAPIPQQPDTAPSSLPLLSEAFRTTESNGVSSNYRMVFKFKCLASLQSADDEWRKFKGAV